MNEEMHRQSEKLNDHRAKALELENRLNQKQYDWLMKAIAKPIASVYNNNAMKTTQKPTTPTANPTLNTQATPKPKTITKEEFKAIHTNPMFKF